MNRIIWRKELFLNILILGCGRVGAKLACALSDNHTVTVVDWNPSSFERLGHGFHGTTVQGNGIDADILKLAGIRQTELFLALTDGDNRNLVAAQIAQLLGVPRVLARVYDPERSRIFDGEGLTTVSPTIEGADRLYRMVLEGQEA